MFLLNWLERSGNLIATVVTLVIVTFGWAIFRTTSVEHLASFTAALGGLSKTVTDTEMQADVPLTLTVGLFLCLLPATPLFAPMQRLYNRNEFLRGLAAVAILLLWVLACGRAFAVPFKPFIYFRF
jgi:alginate O-acetyltransferase complex protein AlgI